MIGKLDESVPEFFTQLFKTLEGLIIDESSNEPGSASEKSPSKKPLKKADVGKSMGNLVHYFNQFQDFFVSFTTPNNSYLQCNFMDEQVAAVKAEAGSKQRAQADAQTLKSVNDSICRSIQGIKLVLHSLKETFDLVQAGNSGNSKTTTQSGLF